MRMWRLRIPQRIKVFPWRALRGVLPTRIKLQEKCVPCTRIRCPHCETNYENDWHVVIGCKEAKKAWTEARLWDLISDVGSAMNFVECIFSLLCRFPCNASHGQLKDRICSTNRYSNINTYRM